MRRLLTLSIFGLLTMLGCQETKDSAPEKKDLSYYRNVGHQIPVETGAEWIDAYNKANGIETGRSILSPYSISRANLDAALESVPNYLGVAFHHAIDDWGVHHFLVIPVDETFNVWASIPGKKFLDANTDTEISAAEAREWAQRYESTHSGGIWYHFFGENIFDEIPTIPYFETLNIVPALNPLNLSPQLLLIILNDGLLSGRLKGEGSVVYDASSPCPPCPVP